MRFFDSLMLGRMRRLSLRILLPACFASGVVADDIDRQSMTRRPTVTWTLAEREFGFAHWDQLYLARTVARGPSVHALPQGAPLAGFEPGGAGDRQLQRHVEEFQLAGIVVLHHGQLRLEHYAHGFGAGGRRPGRARRRLPLRRRRSGMRRPYWLRMCTPCLAASGTTMRSRAARRMDVAHRWSTPRSAGRARRPGSRRGRRSPANDPQCGAQHGRGSAYRLTRLPTMRRCSPCHCLRPGRSRPG